MEMRGYDQLEVTPSFEIESAKAEIVERLALRRAARAKEALERGLDHGFSRCPTSQLLDLCSRGWIRLDAGRWGLGRDAPIQPRRKQHA